MEVAEQAEAEAPALVHFDFKAGCGLKAEILIGRLSRGDLLSKHQHTPLGLKVWLDFLAGAPQQTETNGAETNARNELADCRTLSASNGRFAGTAGIRVAVDVDVFGLVEEDEGQELGDVVHLGLEEIAPGMAIVFNAAGEQFHVVSGGEDLVVSVGI